MTRALFGHLPGGAPVEAVTLALDTGLRATILGYGATLQAMLVPDRHGRLADVTLGHDGLEGYLAKRQFFGATVGRVANRIAGGRFTLDGAGYQVPVNDGGHALHGGPNGFDQLNWAVLDIQGGAEPCVTLGHVSPDGSEGFPGTLSVTAAFALTKDGALRIDYRATTDRPTIVSLTNHAYWNLAGAGGPESAMEHELTIFADHYLPTDAGAIPTGECRAVAGTPFDFRQPTAIGARVREAGDGQIRIGRGYDHHLVAGSGTGDAPRLLARLAHEPSGRAMELSSNRPGLQFYSGNFLDGTSEGKGGRLYRMGDGVALEPQMAPDTANRPAFGSVRLDPGQLYQHRLQFRFLSVTAR